MFTGIIEEKGRITQVLDQSDAIRLSVACSVVIADARPGDSIAVNGVCLTVADLTEGGFTADVMRETLHRSSLGALHQGSSVNLERAMALGSRFGGHIVQGHVDATGQVVRRSPAEHWEVVRISLPDELARYVVEKGSITVDGTSLTVSAKGPGWFEVSLIPTTLAETTLGAVAVGTAVNLEVDILAKYVEQMVAH